MNNNHRRDFLKKISVLAVASAIIPRSLFAGNNPLDPKSNIKDVMNSKRHPLKESIRLVDLHSHPSLKIFLLKKHLWRKHFPGKGDNDINMEVDTRGLDGNGVKGLITTHYLVEKSLVRKADNLKKLFSILKRSHLAARLEKESLANYTQVCEMMNELEEQVKTANEQYYFAEKIVIARNFNEFKAAIERGQIPFAHAIEGAHAVGRIKPISARKRVAYEIREDYALNDKVEIDLDKLSPEMTKKINDEYKKRLAQRPYSVSAGKKEARDVILALPVNIQNQQNTILKNLEVLKSRGVCLITLSHFFPNDLISQPAEGMAPNEEKGLKMNQQYFSANDKDEDFPGDRHTDTTHHPLTPFGRQVVQRMFELGIIVDITHTNPRARKDVFEINTTYNADPNNKIKRPVIFSHSGAKAVFDEHKQYADYGYYNAMDTAKPQNTLYPGYDEIDLINKCGGVIGIIPEIFWLKGGDTHIHGDRRKDYLYGIDYMIETMKYIAGRTGTYDNIAIGTDFDGLADEPKDLFIYNHLSRLTDEMAKQDIHEDDIRKVMNGNAMRVLEKGWT